MAFFRPPPSASLNVKLCLSRRVPTQPNCVLIRRRELSRETCSRGGCRATRKIDRYQSDVAMNRRRKVYHQTTKARSWSRKRLLEGSDAANTITPGFSLQRPETFPLLAPCSCAHCIDFLGTQSPREQAQNIQGFCMVVTHLW